MPLYEVLIVNDVEAQQHSLRDLFESTDDFKVTGIAANGQEALNQVEKYPPDMVIMDLKMPVMDGLEATQRINILNPQIKVIIQTQYADDSRLFRAICSGAWGSISQGASRDEILDVVRRVGENYTVYGPEIAKQIQKFFEQTAQIAPTLASFSQLTPRENEVLHLIAQGKKVREMATILTIQECTVRHHMESIYSKLNINNRHQAMLLAMKTRLPSPNEKGLCDTCPWKQIEHD